MQVRVLSLEDSEFEKLVGKPNYRPLEDGSLERVEGKRLTNYRLAAPPDFDC